MRISHIGIDGVKGRRTNFNVHSTRVLLTGGMGVGKSAVIDGLNLALMLPTRFGQTNLDRISPSGTWSVCVEFADGPVRRLEREFGRARATFMVDGGRVDRSEYEAQVRKVLDVEPHHVSLAEFVGLSGQKRASLFSSMLDLERHELSRVVPDLNGILGQAGPAEVFTDLLPRLKILNGTLAELVDLVKGLLNGASEGERNARIRLEGLARRQASVSHGLNLAELRKRLSAIDERLGALKTDKDRFATERERHAAAEQVLRRHLEAMDQLRALKLKHDEQVVRLKNAQAGMPAVAARWDALVKAGDQAQEEHAKAEKTVQELSYEAVAADRGKVIVEGITKAEWKVPDDWLDAEFEQLLDSLGMTAPPANLTTRHQVLTFVREVVLEVMGGEPEKYAKRMHELQSRLEAAKDVSRAALAQCQQIAKDKAKTHAEASLLSTEKELLARTLAEIVQMDERLAKMDEDRLGLESAVPRAAVSGDESVVDAQIESVAADRERLVGQIKEVEASNAVSGQIEECRVDIARCEIRAMAIKAVLDATQAARDRTLRERLECVRDPFVRAFRTMLGDDIGLSFKTGGQGRSTEFNVTVLRGGAEIPLDLLSDGETVLTAAAFLTALQGMKTGPGSMISLNSESVDARGLRCLLTGLGRLPLDFAIVANNRAAAGDGGAEWQCVDLSSPVVER